jgi:uncharacterized protein with PIN domain
MFKSTQMDYCFAVDKTMGKLAKWLRIMGYDTLYEADISSEWFFEHLEENRILLTRSAKIQKRCATHRMVFVTSNHLNEQLKQVIEDIGIGRADIQPFSRCLHCNLPIVEVNKNDIYNLVPSYIWDTHDDFHKCHRCQRIYWAGSHTKRTSEELDRLFNSN